ncbi:MAG: glycoside hydrolase family 65 protein [Pseudomonadota bacterium]
MPGIFHRPKRPDAAFAGDPWSVCEEGFDPRLAGRAESLFTVGNGFIGARGQLEEDDPAAPAVYLNGVYETVPIHYHERAPGFALASDTRLPAPSGLAFDIRLGDARLALDTGAVEHHQRRLDFKAGLLRRVTRWRTPAGQRLELVSERFASFEDPQLLLILLRLTMLDGTAPLVIASHLTAPRMAGKAGGETHDPRLGPALDAHALEPEARIAEQDFCGLALRAPRSGHGLVSLMAHQWEAPVPFAERREARESAATARFSGQMKAGETLTLHKFIAYASDRGDKSIDLPARARASIARALEAGAGVLKAQQAAYLENYWQNAEVTLEGDARATQAVRFNMVQLLQAAGRDGATSLAAKGQSGEGYEGHYFWDAEIFALPLFAHTAPAIARAMLVYRHGKLAAARAHARAMGHRRGALFPWRTIGGGECSAYFPAGSAQYHINADIAHALRTYVEATGDEAFLFSHGAELLVETARLWLEVGFHNPRRQGRFCIHEVTGPDEYTAMVNNNFYTNAMAAAHLDYACTVTERLAQEEPAAWADLARRLELAAEEPALWRQAAEAMVLPEDAELGIYAQDDSFLEKKIWDFANTPASHYPLLLHYHPLALYRHQVCKQADAILAMALLPGRFDAAKVARSFAYYEAVTVHDSTLSPGIFSIMASEVGEPKKAYGYFEDAAHIDLDDLHGNTGHGLHMAAMAASWMAVVHGFAGMRGLGGRLRFRPLLPPRLKGYAFVLLFQGRRVRVKVDADGVTYQRLAGAPLAIAHEGEDILLEGEAVRRPLRPA